MKLKLHKISASWHVPVRHYGLLKVLKIPILSLFGKLVKFAAIFAAIQPWKVNDMLQFTSEKMQTQNSSIIHYLL